MEITPNSDRDLGAPQVPEEQSENISKLGARPRPRTPVNNWESDGEDSIAVLDLVEDDITPADHPRPEHKICEKSTRVQNLHATSSGHADNASLDFNEIKARTTVPKSNLFVLPEGVNRTLHRVATSQIGKNMLLRPYWRATCATSRWLGGISSANTGVGRNTAHARLAISARPRTSTAAFASAFFPPHTTWKTFYRLSSPPPRPIFARARTHTLRLRKVEQRHFSESFQKFYHFHNWIQSFWNISEAIFALSKDQIQIVCISPNYYTTRITQLTQTHPRYVGHATLGVKVVHVCTIILVANSGHMYTYSTGNIVNPKTSIY